MDVFVRIFNTKSRRSQRGSALTLCAISRGPCCRSNPSSVSLRGVLSVDGRPGRCPGAGVHGQTEAPGHRPRRRDRPQAFPKRRSRRPTLSGDRSPRPRVSGHPEHVEHLPRLPGQGAHRFRDLQSALPDQVYGEASEQRRVCRPVAGVDPAAVLIEAPVKDMVGGLSEALDPDAAEGRFLDQVQTARPLRTNSSPPARWRSTGR